MSAYIINTERLGLRLWKDSDTAPFIAMNKDAAVMRYFPAIATTAETEAMIARIKTHFEKHGFGLYAVEEKSSQQFIGFTGFAVPRFENFFTPCVETGWRLQQKAWGKGYATEAAKACLQYGFEKLNFDKIFSFTSLGNTASEKVMQRIGMKRIGEFDHPDIEQGHILCRHHLYMIEKRDL
ncbi:MAG: GNAT family N-acetyltransferase [Panacibacter sp.]